MHTLRPDVGGPHPAVLPNHLVWMQIRVPDMSMFPRPRHSRPVTLTILGPEEREMAGRCRVQTATGTSSRIVRDLRVLGGHLEDGAVRLNTRAEAPRSGAGSRGALVRPGAGWSWKPLLSTPPSQGEDTGTFTYLVRETAV